MALAPSMVTNVIAGGIASKTRPSPAVTAALAALARLESELHKVVDTKTVLVETAICALLAGGHVLLEDVPGVGKTTFIKALARLLGLRMGRVQFTSDLLPADILGVEVFDSRAQEFVFHQGPVFTEILLADELNRASPRTQSALLEAMGEGQVTVDRKTYALPQPFVVFASQNPLDHVGTYDLPESQLDRFAAKVRLGYPSTRHELDILQAARRDPLAQLPEAVITGDELRTLMGAVDEVHTADRVAAYAKRLIDASRASPELRVGVSTRGGIIWMRMARALALRAGRDFVLPDDLQALAGVCLGHRIVPQAGANAEAVVRQLLASTAVE